jgi:diguanylate cyclase (GGDEF)-like protein
MKWRSIVSAAALLVLWTTFLGLMFRRETALEEERLHAIALGQARALFNQLADVRAWNSSHGGVYAPVTEKTPPNPWLESAERDGATVSGRRLTLLNHAYMTRQIAEVMRERRDIAVHLTSRTPLRPGNEPEPWERAALEAFERGTPEEAVFASGEGGRETFRYMAPLLVETSCLPCHERQGYRVGEVRGGLSVVSSAAALASARRAFRRSAALASLVLWALGAGLLAALTAAFHQRNLLVTRLRELALVDELTGLHNRRGFLLLAHKQLQVAQRTLRPALMLFLDLDGLKLINDEHGHEAGDAALRRLSGVLHAALRSSDILGRYGGDEFAVLCPETGAEAIPRILEALQRRVDEANAGSGRPWRLSLSSGTAVFDPRHPATLEELLRAADAAMYRAKEEKRGEGISRSSRP